MLFWKSIWEGLPKEGHWCRNLGNGNNQGRGQDKGMDVGLGLASSKGNVSRENERRRGWTGTGARSGGALPSYLGLSTPVYCKWHGKPLESSEQRHNLTFILKDRSSLLCGKKMHSQEQRQGRSQEDTVVTQARDGGSSLDFTCVRNMVLFWVHF